MTVYVDDLYLNPLGALRGMKMSHMLADTEDELHRMGAHIGLDRRWYQGDHYDVSLGKRGWAIRLGAVPVTFRQMGAMRVRRRETGQLGRPEEAIAWVRAFLARKRELEAAG